MSAKRGRIQARPHPRSVRAVRRIGRHVGRGCADWTAALNRLAEIAAAEEDDDGIKPTPEIVETARQVASDLESLSVEPPASVVPTVNGGIVFAWSGGGEYHIDEDGVEYRRFENHKLVERKKVERAE